MICVKYFLQPFNMVLGQAVQCHSYATQTNSIHHSHGTTTSMALSGLFCGNKL